MTTSRYVEMDCDSQGPRCDGVIGPERTVAELLRVARAEGWKVRNETVGDQCPSCQADEQDSRGVAS